MLWYSISTLKVNLKVNLHDMHLITLTKWGRVKHVCVSNLTIIGSDNGLPPVQHQAIIRTNAGILSIWTFRKNSSEILSKIHTFSFKKIHLKISKPFCLKVSELKYLIMHTKHHNKGVNTGSEFLLRASDWLECHTCMARWLINYMQDSSKPWHTEFTLPGYQQAQCTVSTTESCFPLNYSGYCRFCTMFNWADYVIQIHQWYL